MRTLASLILTALTLAAQGLDDPAFVASLTQQAAAAACATTDTTLPHDTLLEGFQTVTTGYNDGNAYTVTETDPNGGLDPYGDSSGLTTGKPAGACDRAMQVVVQGDGVETFSTWDLGSTIDIDAQELTLVFYLYIESGPDTSGENLRILNMHLNAGSGLLAGVNIYNTSGTIYIRATGTSDSTLRAITTGTWHKLTIHIDSDLAGSTSTFQVDAGSVDGFNRGNVDLRYLLFGSPQNVDVNDNGTLWFDVICLEKE